MEEDRITLTIKERIFLANQYLILEALYPENSKVYKGMREIVENGFELHYSELNLTTVESRLSEKASLEVMDILDMYRALNDSYKRLENKESITEEDLQFEGFDGNNESDLLNYAQFLIFTQGRWREVLEGRPEFDLNSHSHVIEVYRRMLKVWHNIGKKFVLNRDEIKQILDAKTHPEYR